MEVFQKVNHFLFKIKAFKLCQFENSGFCIRQIQILLKTLRVKLLRLTFLRSRFNLCRFAAGLSSVFI